MANSIHEQLGAKLWPLDPSLKRERAKLDSIILFTLEVSMKHSIDLRYAGTHTSGKLNDRKIETALLAYDRRKKQNGVSFDEYLWDVVDLNPLARKQGLVISDMDELPLCCLQGYRYTGSLLAKNLPSKILPIYFVQRQF